jgi:sec-independent protein translocase protein TatA
MTELIVVLVIALIIFGSNKLPEIGSGMGRAIKNFKKGITEPEVIEFSSKDKEPKDKEPKESS